jgi:methionyl-tRNA formyltransferase
MKCLTAHFYTGSNNAAKKPFDILFFGRDEFSCNVFKQLHDARGKCRS